MGTYELYGNCASMDVHVGSWSERPCGLSMVNDYVSGQSMRICEKSAVKTKRNEGIKVGDRVRVRASVARPSYGWGDGVDHNHHSEPRTRIWAISRIEERRQGQGASVCGHP